MAQAYLFVHFREKTTPDGEQVYFGISRDVRSDASFSFPYGYKHGTILPITEEDYERIKNHDWSDHGYQ